MYLDVGNIVDAKNQQRALDVIAEWANEWQLQCAAIKFICRPASGCGKVYTVLRSEVNSASCPQREGNEL